MDATHPRPEPGPRGGAPHHRPDPQAGSRSPNGFRLHLKTEDPRITGHYVDQQLTKKRYGHMLDSLGLDGYVYKDGRLLAPESDVLDTRETAGVLEQLYDELGLGEKKVALHCLKLSEDHW